MKMDAGRLLTLVLLGALGFAVYKVVFDNKGAKAATALPATPAHETFDSWLSGSSDEERIHAVNHFLGALKRTLGPDWSKEDLENVLKNVED